MGLSREFGAEVVLACAVALCLAFAVRFLRFALRGRVAIGSGKMTVEADLTVSFAGLTRRAAYRLPRSAVVDELAAAVARIDSSSSGSGGLGQAELLRLVRDFLARVAEGGGFRSAEALVWLGTGDAAATAIGTGIVNGLLGAAGAVWSSSATFPRRFRALCTPVWSDSPFWRIELDCILAPTLSQAIYAAWRVYRLVRARKSHSAAADAAVQEKGRGYAGASHSGFDEDGHVNHQGNG